MIWFTKFRQNYSAIHQRTRGNFTQIPPQVVEISTGRQLTSIHTLCYIVSVKLARSTKSVAKPLGTLALFIRCWTNKPNQTQPPVWRATERQVHSRLLAGRLYTTVSNGRGRFDVLVSPRRAAGCPNLRPSTPLTFVLMIAAALTHQHRKRHCSGSIIIISRMLLPRTLMQQQDWRGWQGATAAAALKSSPVIRHFRTGSFDKPTDPGGDEWTD